MSQRYSNRLDGAGESDREGAPGREREREREKQREREREKKRESREQRRQRRKSGAVEVRKERTAE